MTDYAPTAAVLEAARRLVEGGPADAPSTGDAGALLELIGAFIRRYVVVSDMQLVAVALWIAHSHAIDAAHATPYLVVRSAEKRSGKTRLLETLELLAARAWRVTSPSEAALFRKIAQDRPTLLLDEVDAIFGSSSERTEPLRAILNAGNRRGSKIPRCVGDGGKQRVEDFDVFGPKALAGIDTGRLPDTIVDRAIVVTLSRKAGDEPVQRFRHRDANDDAEPIRQALAAWAEVNIDELGAARPEEPAGLDDRSAEAWEPLLAIADHAGGEWPAKARAAATALSGEEDCDEASVGVKLLAAIRDALKGRATISTTALLDAINADDELPFGGWSDGRGLDARTLARKLKPYGIKPRTVRVGDETSKGYHVEQLEDAWRRYLPGTPDKCVTSVTSVTTQQNGARKRGDVTDVTDVTAISGYPSREGPSPAESRDRDGLPAAEADPARMWAQAVGVSDDELRAAFPGSTFSTEPIPPDAIVWEFTTAGRVVAGYGNAAGQAADDRPHAAGRLFAHAATRRPGTLDDPHA